MAISVAGVSPMNMTPISSVRAVKPQNYAIENKSEVSDAFSKSLASYGVEGIVAPTPVQYANADVESNKVNAVEDASQANKYFNDIASGFSGMNTSYNASGAGSGYGMVGSMFDAAV